MRKLLAVALCALAVTVPAHAEDEEGLVTFKALTPELAFQLAFSAMEVCREEGYQVGVAVVDRFGTLQTFVRDRFAGTHTIDTSQRKAWTAVSFRTNTTELDELVQPGEPTFGLRQIPGALVLGGGVILEVGGSIVAGIGVSGAPSPQIDEDCAIAGIEAIEDALPF